MLLYDAGKKDELESSKLCCKVCGLTEENLKQGNPLVYFNPSDKSFTYCKECLDNFVQQNTRMSFKSNGVIEYFVDNMCVPGTGIEFPSKYKVNGVPFDLINLQYPFSPFYLILERINYKRPPGHKEGFILRFGMPDQDEYKVSVGSHPNDNIYLLDAHLHHQHFTVLYSEGVFLVQDHPESSGTFILKAAKWDMNDYYRKRAVISRDTIIKFSFVTELLHPPDDCIDQQVDLFPQQFPASAYEAHDDAYATNQSRPSRSPGLEKRKDGGQSDPINDIDERLNDETTSNLRSIRQFSSRFKPSAMQRTFV